MKYLPKNTLAHYNAAPQGHRHNLSKIPTKVFAAATKDYRENCGLSSPHNDALTFYTLNHCVAIVRKLFTPNEPLPPWAAFVLASYANVVNDQGKRMLHYILSICCREMRHLQSHGQPSEEFWTKMMADFGTSMVTFMKAITMVDENNAVNKYMNAPPDVPIGAFIKAMSYGFHKAQGWAGPQQSYGGPKWGLVADAATEMLTGKTSMEMLVDTGYTLAHNGGPIFNKGMLYHGYDSTLITILDVQRSGQTPELILDPGQFGIKKTPDAVTAVKLVAEALPNEFRGWVDWQAVEDTLPKKEKEKYETYVKMMKKAHPTMAPHKAKVVSKVFDGKKVVVTGSWNVYPGQTVEVFERVA